MTSRGHELLITARKKECSLDLLEGYGLGHRVVSEQAPGSLALALEMVSRTRRVLDVMRDFRPDVLTGIMGPTIAVAGWIRSVPAVVFYDTEFAWQTNWFAYPLAHSVCTPDCYQERVRGRHVTYPGYHELAYLHPGRFTPDPARLAAFGVAAQEPFSILRFVSWQAVHDTSERGLTPAEKRLLLETLSAHGKVLISSEGPLPADLEPYRIRGPVEDIHHLLALAQMIVGESATMTSEAAVLGVPAVLIAKTGRGYTDDQERRYGHVRTLKAGQVQEAIRVIERFFAEGPRALGARARVRLLAEKIDVTAWMVDYFERTFAAGGSLSSLTANDRNTA